MKRPASILLVDDSRMGIELSLEALREAGVASRVEVAGGGQQALDYLFGGGESAAPCRPPPDLVLLDLKMPVIDGFEVLRRVKETPLLRRIPVVILSSSAEEGDRARAYDLGANSYLVKPVSFDALLDLVRSVEHYWLQLNVAPPRAAD